MDTLSKLVVTLLFLSPIPIAISFCCWLIQPTLFWEKVVALTAIIISVTDMILAWISIGMEKWRE